MTERHNLHILINALSMGSGGGLTVGREILRHLALERPAWQFTCAIIGAHRLHQKLRDEKLPSNCRLLEAPVETLRRRNRARWEKQELTAWADQHRVNAVVQLNGMLVPGMRPPSLCHMQDPWPYRSEAWVGLRDRFIAMLKRREHRHTLRHAAAFGWTSAYLRDLICGYHNVWPPRSEVLYNGVPPEWIDRARRRELPPWDARPNRIVTISNVNAYKRQSLVIRALPELVRRPGLEDLAYHIVGEPESQRLCDELMALASRLGVADHVKIEGRVSDDKVREFFANSRCFVLMSVCESFGIPAIEAMSFGTPVVTADCCAMPEVCGNAAELAPMDDVKGLVEKLEAVLLDPAHARELQMRGVERVAHFSWQETAQRMAQLLEKIATNAAIAEAPAAPAVAVAARTASVASPHS